MLSLPRGGVVRRLRTRRILRVVRNGDCARLSLERTVVRGFNRRRHFFAYSTGGVSMSALVRFLGEGKGFVPTGNKFAISVAGIYGR